MCAFDSHGSFREVPQDGQKEIHYREPEACCTHQDQNGFMTAHSSFIDFQVWDFPGQMDFFDPTFDTTAIFGEVGALVFVIDSQVRTGPLLARSDHNNRSIIKTN